MRSRTVLECVGAALLLLFPFYLPLFTYQNHILFFHGLPVTHLIGGLLVDLLFVFALLISLMVAAQYVAPSIRSSLDAMFAGIMLWGLLNSAIVVLSHLLNIDVRWLDIWKYSIIVVPIVMTLLVIYLPHITEPAIRGIRLVTAAFAFSGLWIVPQLINIAMVRKATASPTPQYLVSKSSGGPSNRIVWILFDELSYRQVIADPVPGIKFPNFDQLNGRSFSFSNVKPFGYWTDRIRTNLLTGGLPTIQKIPCSVRLSKMDGILVWTAGSILTVDSLRRLLIDAIHRLPMFFRLKSMVRQRESHRSQTLSRCQSPCSLP